MFELTSTSSNRRILIIDDDRELAMSVQDILAIEGFEVDIACNGREGIRMHNATPYELIITDIVMPEEDGLEVIMWVKKMYPGIGLIAISGGGYFDSRDYLKMAKELGANLVFSKPFEVKALLAGIKNILKIPEKVE